MVEAVKKHHNQQVRVQGRSPFAPRRICILPKQEGVAYEHVGVNYRCQSFNHRHFTRARVDELVAVGEMVWVGLGKNKARWVEGKSWRKTICAGGGWVGPTMQLVSSGGLA